MSSSHTSAVKHISACQVSRKLCQEDTLREPGKGERGWGGGGSSENDGRSLII